MLSGDADLVVRGPRSGFDESLYPWLARHPSIAVASPVVDADARAAGRSEPLRVQGVDLFRAGALQPGWVAQTRDALDTLRPDVVFLSPAALAWLGVEVGARIRLHAGLRDVDLRVAGVIDGSGGERLALMDIAGAQSLFERLGRISRVDLRVAPGVALDDLRRDLAARLPAGVSVDRPEAASRATERISRSYRVNLTVLALVALFTGGLVVFSTQALSVIRRRTQFALLRTLGMTRRRLAALCVLEGALLGAAGGVAGVAAGYAIAWAALRFAGADLGSGFFRGVSPQVSPEPLAALFYLALGVAAAALGSLAPAREAAAASPARALKAGDEEHAYDILRPSWRGLVTIALGACLLPLPAVAGLPLAGYAAIACFLIGTLLLLPTIARRVLAWWPMPSRAAPALALAQLRASPGRVSASLAAIVASVSLMVSMAIMVSSFRDSLDRWLERILPAPLYVRVPGSDLAWLDPDDQARIRSLPGVASVDFQREDALVMDADRPRVILIARDLDERSVERKLPLVEGPVARPAGSPPPAWVNEAMVALYGFAPGTVARLPIAGREVPLFVAGVWRDYGRPHGAVQIDRTLYVALTGDRRANGAGLWLAPGAEPNGVRAALAAMPGGARLEIAEPGEIRALSLAAFDRTFAVTYALELAAVAIGLVGLSSAFSALVLARRREFGVLRHLGMTRRQVGTMLATEGAITAALGAAVGLALGAAISFVLIHVVNRQSFHWGMELAWPWGSLALLAFSVVLLATLTAVASGRRAMGDDVVRAVKEDW